MEQEIKRILEDINKQLGIDKERLTELQEDTIRYFLDKELGRYMVAYNLLMEYFDNIPEEDKEELSKELEKVGL